MTESQQTADEAQKLVGQAINRIAEQEAAAAALPPPPGQTRQRATLSRCASPRPCCSGSWHSIWPVRRSPSGSPPGRHHRWRGRTPSRCYATLVTEIEAFREDYGDLPETIHEVGAPRRATWRYEAFSSTGYRVHGSLQGQDVSFDSSRGTSQ